MVLRGEAGYTFFKSQEVVTEQATINPIECNLFGTFYHDFDDNIFNSSDVYEQLLSQFDGFFIFLIVILWVNVFQMEKLIDFGNDLPAPKTLAWYKFIFEGFKFMVKTLLTYEAITISDEREAAFVEK